jgi:hypothetical protein
MRTVCRGTGNAKKMPRNRTCGTVQRKYLLVGCSCRNNRMCSVMHPPFLKDTCIYEHINYLRGLPEAKNGTVVACSQGMGPVTGRL